jgi:hypothetical protein
MTFCQKFMIANGLLVVLVAMVAGFMLLFSLVGGFEIWPGKIIIIDAYGTTEGWVRAHTGGLLNGILVIVMGQLLPSLDLTSGMRKFMAYGFVYIAWSFTVFYWVGNATANRSLTLGDSPLGESSFTSIIGFLPGFPSVFLVIVLLIVAVKAVVARPETR